MLDIDRTLYQLDGVIRNSNQEILAEMTLNYNPKRAQNYTLDFYSIHYDLLNIENLENRLIFSDDMLAFIDKAHEMIQENS